MIARRLSQRADTIKPTAYQPCQGMNSAHFRISYAIETRLLKEAMGRISRFASVARRDLMATAYVIANIRVTDPEKFHQYKRLSTAAVQTHGGRFLIRGGRLESVEGT